MDKPHLKFGFTPATKGKKLHSTVVFPVYQGAKKNIVTTDVLEKHCDVKKAAFKNFVKSMNFSAKSGEIVVAPSLDGLKTDRVVLVGLGKYENLNAENLESAAAKLFSTLDGLPDTEVDIYLDLPKGTKKAKLKLDEIGYHLSVGLMLKSYRFDKYKGKPAPKALKDQLKKVNFICADDKELKARVQDFEKVSGGVFLTRSLVNEPANKLDPQLFVKRIKEQLKGTGIKIRIMGEKKLKSLKMDMMLSVGHAATSESTMVVMEYDGRGRGKKKDEKPIAFVGKGVCFDTGGNSMKPSTGMMGMHMDMGGAAVVVGLMKALAARKAKVHVVGAVGLVENMVAGNATRPNDVVTSMSGQTVEILNTDAEGRLVLGDVMWYVQEKYKPSKMIDLATLTGAIIVSLGGEYAGAFSNDDKMAQSLLESGGKVREPVWHMPLCDAYDKALKSSVADMQNIGASSVGAGSATAAAFLQRFVQKDVSWTHLDIAGVTMKTGSWYIGPKGGTGYGVRLLDQWLRDNAEAK